MYCIYLPNMMKLSPISIKDMILFTAKTKFSKPIFYPFKKGSLMVSKVIKDRYASQQNAYSNP
jgi:hypothetical protein